MVTMRMMPQSVPHDLQGVTQASELEGIVAWRQGLRVEHWVMRQLD
jgi:hypothetical protein